VAALASMRRVGVCVLCTRNDSVCGQTKTCVKKCETESRRFCQSSLHKCVNLRVHRLEHATALCSCCLYRRPWSELSSEVPPPLLLSAASSPAAASAALPSRLRSSMRCGISIHMPVKTVYCVVYTQNKPTAPYLRTRQGRTTSRVAVAPGHPRWRLASKSSTVSISNSHTHIYRYKYHTTQHCRK
jgi:hypothetical protein